MIHIHSARCIQKFYQAKKKKKHKIQPSDALPENQDKHINILDDNIKFGHLYSMAASRLCSFQTKGSKCKLDEQNDAVV